MRTICKSLIGTLAAVIILAGTAGASLYFCHRMELAIRNAVVRQFAELQSEEVICGVLVDASNATDAAAGESGGCEEMSQPGFAGALVDSNVVAVLIEELGEASAAERGVWTKLLRSPASPEAFRNLISHYHGKTPHPLQPTNEPVQVASAEVPQQSASPCSCQGPEIIGPEKSSVVITSAIETLQEAEQLLLKKAVNEYLFELCQLREHLIEKRQQLQQLKDEAVQSADSPMIDED